MVHGVEEIHQNKNFGLVMQDNMFSLAGKDILLTGATGRVGQELAHAFADMAANLTLIGRSQEKLEALLSKIQLKNTCSPRIEVLDINSEDEIKHYLRKLHEEDINIDGLVHCAMSRPGQIVGYNYKNALVDSIRSNAISSILLWDGIAQHMSHRNGGSLVYIGSVYGKASPDFSIYTGLQMGTEPDYVFIKEGMNGISKYYANKFGEKNVRSNVVILGGVFDNQPEAFVRKYIQKVPLKRMADTGDIVGACVYLLSESSSYVTGSELFVDGGYHSR